MLFDASDEDAGVPFDSSKVCLLITQRHTPYIYAITNDNTKTLADFKDYSSTNTHIGACFSDYRNIPKVWARLTYKDKSLQLDMDLTGGDLRAYKKCFSVLDVSIDTGLSFRISASTMDNHEFGNFTPTSRRLEKAEGLFNFNL